MPRRRRSSVSFLAKEGAMFFSDFDIFSIEIPRQMRPPDHGAPTRNDVTRQWWRAPNQFKTTLLARPTRCDQPGRYFRVMLITYQTSGEKSAIVK